MTSTTHDFLVSVTVPVGTNRSTIAGELSAAVPTAEEVHVADLPDAFLEAKVRDIADDRPFGLTLITDSLGAIGRVYVSARRLLGHYEHEEEMDLLRTYFPGATISFLPGYRIDHVITVPEPTQYFTAELGETAVNLDD